MLRKNPFGFFCNIGDIFNMIHAAAFSWALQALPHQPASSRRVSGDLLDDRPEKAGATRPGAPSARDPAVTDGEAWNRICRSVYDVRKSIKGSSP